MPEVILVADAAAYLEDTGWRRTASWRGASIWARGAEEVLLPARDDLGDNPLRIRELLQTLAAVESRPARDIVREISFPLADSATYKLLPDDLPAGFTTLHSGVQAVGGLRDVIAAAARAALEGPHFRFTGRAPHEIGDLLARIKVGAGTSDDVAFTLLVPFDRPPAPAVGSGLAGREVMLQMQDAASAVEEASRSEQIRSFDDVVTAGASADFCVALSDLAGQQRKNPFQIAFRWSRGMQSDLPGRTVSFAADSGVLIREAAARLRRLEISGHAAVSGRIEGLHDDSAGTDRWRVRLRGELRTDRLSGNHRAIWVRLGGQQDYDLAIEAHRSRLRVHAEGVLSNRAGRAELAALPGHFELDQTSTDH
jgi:hypothetical protein